MPRKASFSDPVRKISQQTHHLFLLPVPAEVSMAAEGLSSPGSSGKDPPPSPMIDRKKHRRKKLATPSKTEGSAGQAEGKTPLLSVMIRKVEKSPFLTTVWAVNWAC